MTCKVRGGKAANSFHSRAKLNTTLKCLAQAPLQIQLEKDSLHYLHTDFSHHLSNETAIIYYIYILNLYIDIYSYICLIVVHVGKCHRPKVLLFYLKPVTQFCQMGSALQGICAWCMT